MIRVSKNLFRAFINSIKKNGISEFIFLVGFKSEKIQNYFGNGKRFGVKINYSYSNLKTET